MTAISRPKRPTRHTIFYQLRETLDSPGCPVCRLSLASVSGYLESFAYESVNDLALRDHLRASLGFCSHHAWQLLRRPSGPFTVAILYADVLSHLVGQMIDHSPSLVERLRRGGISGDRLAGRLLPGAPCLACQALQESEDRYLSTLLAHLSEADFSAAYRHSGGLCLPHLTRALGRTVSLGDRASLLETALSYLRAGLGEGEGSDQALASPAEMLFGAVGALPDRRATPSSLIGDEEGWVEPDAGELASTPDDGCPICHLMLRTAAAELVRLEAGAAEEAATLCSHHARQILDSARPETGRKVMEQARLSAIIRVTEWAPDIGTKQPSILAMVGLGPEAAPKGDRMLRERGCPVETQMNRVTVGYAQFLADSAELAPLRVGPSRPESSRLCIPHLRLALSCSEPSKARALARLVAASLEELASELREYLRKHDYRFHGEPRGRESSSPQRAVELVVGPEGLRAVGGPWRPRN